MTTREKQNLLAQLTVFINSLSVEDETKAPAEPKMNEKIELLIIGF